MKGVNDNRDGIGEVFDFCNVKNYEERAFDDWGSALCVAVVVGRSHSNLRRHLNKEKELSPISRIAHSEVKNKWGSK